MRTVFTAIILVFLEKHGWPRLPRRPRLTVTLNHHRQSHRQLRNSTHNSSKIELRDRDARQFKRQYIYNNHRSYSRHCSLEILRGHPVENDIMYAYDDDRYTLTIVVFDDVGATKPSPHTAVAPIPHAGRPAVFRTSLLGC